MREGENVLEMASESPAKGENDLKNGVFSAQGNERLKDKRHLRRLLLPFLILFLSAGCLGECLKLPLRDNLNAEQMQWVRKRQEIKRRDAARPGVLAMRREVVLPAYFRARVLRVTKPGTEFWFFSEDVMQTPADGSYMYREITCYGFPLPAVGLTEDIAWYNADGRNIGHKRWKSWGVVLLEIIGGGEFDYVGDSSRYLFDSYLPAPLFIGLLPAWLLPADWYFDGNSGTYWHALLGLVGHIKTDRSNTLVLLGYIPIKCRSYTSAQH